MAATAGGSIGSSPTRAPGDGRNHGWINWIVTKSRAGVRINAGGTAAVVITARAETYTIVCPTPEQARLCAQLFDA